MGLPFFRLAAAALVALWAGGCRSKEPIWVYTSLYEDAVREMEPLLRQAVPGVEVKFYRGGSERLAETIRAELETGLPKADVLVTADPFLYTQLKAQGELLPYESPAARDVPAEFTDPEHAFTTCRILLMALGYNPTRVEKADLPGTWEDLALPKWKGKISMGDPNESGSAFTSVAFLSKAYGWGFFEKLRANDLIAASGTNAVIRRIESGERPVGILLFEDILRAQEQGVEVRPLCPTGGVLLIPGRLAIMKSTQNHKGAKRVYDWLLSDEAQGIIARKGSYSPFDRIPPPRNARPWKELEASRIRLGPEALAELSGATDDIKRRFDRLFGR